MRFIIQETDFYLNNILSSDETVNFTVKSMPKNYNVTVQDSIDIDFDENCLFLIDSNVYNLYFNSTNFIPEDKIYLLDAKEENKNLDTVQSIIQFLQKKNFTKGNTLIVIGGGLTQDVGAFVGACYKRGIKWVYYPTTLLSMSDSCIGGKTGLNFGGAKNQVALFSSPNKVNINVNFLRTLSEFDTASGMGEVLKLCTTGGFQLLNRYNAIVRNGKTTKFKYYKNLILQSLAVKKAVVEEDEFEFSFRKSMNYGHTVGHVIEILSNYKIPHGHAVSAGIIIANKLSLNKGFLNKEDYYKIKKLCLDLLGHDSNIVKNLDTNELKKLLLEDKKVQGDLIDFVLIKGMGNTVFQKVNASESLIKEIEDIIKEEF